MPKIDYFFTPLSPYTYLAGGALENIAEKVRASIHYRPLDVVSLFGRTGGVALPDRHPSRLDYRAQDLNASRSDVGYAISFETCPCAHQPRTCILCNHRGAKCW